MNTNDGRVVSNFIVQALQDQDISMYGDGLQTRSFCYVDDLIAGFIKLMDSPDEFTGPVNLGNPNEFSMLQLAQQVITLIGSKSNIIFKDLPQDDPKQRQPNIELAKSMLEWQPSIELEQGLTKTINYFKDTL
jgi:UDP-glucuronate decarboxylase